MHSFLQSGASLVHAQILGMCANMETLTINLGMSYSRLLIRVKFTQTSIINTKECRNHQHHQNHHHPHEHVRTRRRWPYEPDSPQQEIDWWLSQPSFTPLRHGHLLHRAHNFCHHDNRQQRHWWFTFSPLLHHYCVAITFSIFFIISRSHQNQNHLLNHHHHLQVSSFSIFFIISKSHYGGGGFSTSIEGHQRARCWVREERKSGQEEMKQSERVQIEMERCYLVVVLC